MKRPEPALNVERFDVLGDLVAPARNEIIADDVLGDDDGVFRLRTHGMVAEVGLQVVLCKGVETDANIAGIIVDAYPSGRPI